MPAHLIPSELSRPKTPSRPASGTPTPAYVAGLSAAALALVMVPLCYLALVSVLAGAALYHAIHHFSWFISEGPLQALGYTALAALFAVPCGFLLAPMVHRPYSSPAGIVLDPDSEPRLFAFIGQICNALGMPMPKCIRVNMDVNASARFAAGLGNVAAGRLELSLGLPLVRGLDLAQFAGVLAHELGHFGQGGAMRLVYAIRTMNTRFARAGSERWAWEKEAPGSGNLLGDLLLPFHFTACLMARFSRLLLRGHSRAGQMVSCVLLRQMERHADRVAVRLVGGEVFASMVLEAKVIEAAWGLSSRSLGLALREGRLADDLPSLVAAHTRVFNPEVRRKMEQSLLYEPTAWFDTHPGMAERIGLARRFKGRGMFRAAGPAYSLFLDFHALARRQTRDFYRRDLGEDFRAERMLSTPDLLSGHSDSQVGEAAMAGYFGGLATPLRPLHLDPSHLEAKSSKEDAKERLIAARARVEKLLPEAAAFLDEYAELDARRLNAAQALALSRSKFLIEAVDFQLAGQGPIHAQAAFDNADSRMRILSAALDRFESASRERLSASLVLLGTPLAKESLSDAPILAQESKRLLPVLAVLGKVQPHLETLRIGYHSLRILIENMEGNEEVKDLHRQMRVLAGAMRSDLQALRKALEGQDHPFSPGEAGYSLADYALEAIPFEGDIGGLYRASEEALERCHALYSRIMGRLALAAGRIEGALGLGPLQVDLFPLSHPQDGDQ